MRETWLLLDSRGIGGIETHVAELASGLLAASARPRVLFLRDHGPHPLRARLDRAGVPWDCLSGSLTALCRRLRDEKPSVLHTHGYKANLLGRVAARMTGTAIVASYHAGERPGGRLALYDWLDRWTAFLGQRIAVSAPIAARLPYPATLVPNFVAVPAAAPKVRHDPVNEKQIAFVGRLSAEKGPDRFLAIAACWPAVRFALYGDGPMRETLRRIACPNTRFMGAPAGMDDAWSSIELLVISSRAEGLPLAALEAMAHGVPVATFALGGLPGLIEDGWNGFLARPDDLTALADCIARWRALTAEERDLMAHAAWETVASRFSREVGVAAIQAVYARAEARVARHAAGDEAGRPVWRAAPSGPGGGPD